MDEAEYCHRVALINQGRLIAIGSPAELKQTALGGELLLIECDALGATLAALQDAPGVRDCAVFGNALHVLVDNAEKQPSRSCRAFSPRRACAAPHRARSRHRSRTSSCSSSRPTSRSRRARRMRLRRLKAIAVKEMLQIWRDPRSLMIALLMPFMQMMLLGYGVSLDLKHIPVCTFDREASQDSQALLKRFEASPYFAIARNVADLSGAGRLPSTAATASSPSSSRRISPSA